jgi:hypothetical protein
MDDKPLQLLKEAIRLRQESVIILFSRVTALFILLIRLLIMHAVQPVTSPQHHPSPQPQPQPQSPQTRQPRRSTSQNQIQQRQQQQIRALTMEIGIKLATHLILSGVAVSALWQIVPKYRASQEKLSQIQSEVQMTQQRVDYQKANFSRNFDPQQAQSIMQEHTNKVAPGQRQVVWLEDIEVDEAKISQASQTKSQP